MIPDLAAEAGKSNLSDASLVVLDKDLKPTTEAVHFRFNPTEFAIAKANSFAEIAIPGLNAPPVQFIRGGAEKLSFELLLDTSQEVKDVRTEFVDKLRGLMDIRPDLHAPPVLQFTWDKGMFTGVMDSLSITYTLFAKGGIPVRAKASVSLKQYAPVSIQVKATPKNSPDVEKVTRVTVGDTLERIAARAYGDPGRWREIARANHIDDPRSLQVGVELVIPVLEGA